MKNRKIEKIELKIDDLGLVPIFKKNI